MFQNPSWCIPKLQLKGRFCAFYGAHMDCELRCSFKDVKKRDLTGVIASETKAVSMAGPYGRSHFLTWCKLCLRSTTFAMDVSALFSSNNKENYGITWPCSLFCIHYSYPLPLLSDRFIISACPNEIFYLLIQYSYVNCIHQTILISLWNIWCFSHDSITSIFLWFFYS